MKILLIGASGFLGQELLKSLLVYHDIEKMYCLIHKNAITIEDKRLHMISGDIKNLSVLYLTEKIDICVLLSGITNGRGYSAKDTMNINYGGTKNAIQYCKQYGIKKIILTSSINVQLKKMGAYAKSKQLAEKAVVDSDMQYIIFRPALIYGYHQKLGLGVIEKSIRKMGIVPVFGNGKKLEQPVFVKECADIMAYYIIHEQKNRIIEVLGKKAYTYNELCKSIAKLINKKVILIHLPILPFELCLKLFERLKISFPLSVEQIYHIDTDLAGDMTNIYNETGVYGDLLENNYLKKKI